MVKKAQNDYVYVVHHLYIFDETADAHTELKVYKNIKDARKYAESIFKKESSLNDKLKEEAITYINEKKTIYQCGIDGIDFHEIRISKQKIN